MAQSKTQKILLKRSGISGSIPTTTTLEVGEIALNTYDGKAFIHKSGSTETIEQLVVTNSDTTGDISILGTGSFGTINVANDLIVSGSVYGVVTGSFGEMVIQNDANISGSIYVKGDVVGAGDVDIIGSVTASAFVGDGSGLTNLPVQSVAVFPGNDFDYNVDDSTYMSDFNNANSAYDIDTQWENFTGTPLTFKGGLRDVTAATDIIPTTSSLDIRVEGELVARFSKTTSTFYGIGDVLAFSGSLATRLTNLEYGMDAGAW